EKDSQPERPGVQFTRADLGNNAAEFTLESSQIRTLELKWIQPGTFLMGSPEDDEGRSKDEGQHQVTLTQPFFLGVTEVTQGEYVEIMGGENPSGFKNVGMLAPVESVDWEQATEFCKKLTALERRAGRLPEGWEYRLPTEAQWEYACRAGTTSEFSFGESEKLLPEFAWYIANSENTTHPVRTRKANSLGLFDMHGNVDEWCQDWYDDYKAGAVTDPAGPGKGSYRVVRSGSWGVSAQVCRAAFRGRVAPSNRNYSLGFRVAAVQQSDPGKEPSRDAASGATELVFVPPGQFEMGSPEGQGEYSRDQLLHRVKLSTGFYLAKREVTQAQYEAIMGKKPSDLPNDFAESKPSAPVEGVSWDDAQEFCQKLTGRDSVSGVLPNGYVYTLPTEAQWEYACRAGSITAFTFGNNEMQLDEFAWYRRNSNAEAHPVGERTPNAFGLYDMHG
ncbi:MAG: formylglycine-generating enzyme family protein, partial [Planctomycetota bacterium]|nr:formylglycine-generating enzyme family protein [Planctomycetota bacterium]